MKLRIVFVFLILFSAKLFSQATNEYKIVILPSKFDFFEEPNKYNLNSLMKFFFEEQGFSVYYNTDILPDDIANENCDKLYVDVIRDRSLFVTKMTVEVKNCKKEVLVTSTEGKSREKEYNVSYNDALRQALTSLKGQLKFKIPAKKAETKEVNTVAKIETKKEETDPINAGVPDKKEIISNYKLSAVPNENGFKLVNSNLDVIFELLKTSKSDVFIVNGKKGGIVSALNSRVWKYDYYENGKLVSEVIEILNL